MKKVLIIMGLLLLFTGCSNKNNNTKITKYIKKINNSEAYSIKGTMEITNDSDLYTYSISVLYKNPDYYKVNLINQSNNHEQVILKNKDGVYVVTPALNKSFKFQSNWPDNSSQAYLLKSLTKDIGKNYKVNTKNNTYYITANVNYPNNPDLTYQEVYFNSNGVLKEVLVKDDNDITRIKVIFKDINLNDRINEEEFNINGLIKEENNEVKTGSLEEFIYPLYIPTNTFLNTKETIDTDNGKRNILTFNGDKSFTLIEENACFNDELEIIPVYGDPLFINDTIGAISANSIYWTSNNIDYYLTSNNLESNDLITIASSVGNTILVGKWYCFLTIFFV